MAASGSTIVNATYNSSGTTVCDVLKFSWWENGQSIADNTTYVRWKLELIAYEYGRINSTATKSWSVTVNGTPYSGKNTVGISANSTKTLASGSTPIVHDDDGTKTFAYSFSQYFGIDFNGNVGTKSGSGNGTLTTIARASQPSLINKYPNTVQNVGDFGKTITIYTNRKSNVFTHTVRYAFGSQSGTIATGVTDSTPWTIPLSLMNLIPNSTSGSGTVYVDTYNGSTLVGTKWTGFTATVPSSVKPSCSCSLEDITGIDDTYGSPVQGLSKIKVTVNATLAYSSSIKSYSITIDGVKYSTSTAITGLLVKPGISTVTATVIDGRGRSDSWTYDMNVQEYSKPAITKLTVHRCDSDGTENEQGEYIKATISAVVSSMDNKNTMLYVLQYKKTSEAAYTDVVLTALDGNYAPSNYSEVFEADGNSSYDVVLTAMDSHTSVSRSTSASTAFTLFNCHTSGTGWRFGGVAEKENTLQNDLDFNQVGNSYAFQPDSFSGAKGYTLLATITLNALNVNAPIVFTINRRGALCPMQVYIRFASSSTTNDPDLGSITYEGDNYGAFLVKETTSTWKLYVDNTSGWSNPCLQSWYTTDNQMSQIAVTFPSEQVDGTDPKVLGAYYRATPARMQSILDFVYPVGSVYISYSHVSPATLFGGTWERIENAFLWAVGADGTIGQTGGEKTHTLTLNEIPSHNHGGTYTNAGTASKTHAWLTANGSAMAYDTVNVGGGKAHNNMPPYIQVSIWRRTA